MAPSGLSPFTGTGTQSFFATDPCAALSSLSLENTIIVAAFSQKSGKVTPIPLPCTPGVLETVITTSCVASINATSESSVKFEARLPDTWYGRFRKWWPRGVCVTFISYDNMLI